MGDHYHQAEVGADAQAGLMRIPVSLSVEVPAKQVILKKLDLDRGCAPPRICFFAGGPP